LRFEASLDFEKPYLENIQHKKGQVECLRSKCEALNSKPSTAQKKVKLEFKGINLF
jgi:hypothetical protein